LLRRKKKACLSRLAEGRVPAVHMKEFCEMEALTVKGVID
jgi:hypothetical protein